MQSFTDLFSKVEKKLRENEKNNITHNLNKKNTQESLHFDEHIIIFKNMVKHRKLAKDFVYIKDLYYWFPECTNKNITGISPIPYHLIEKGLEIFITEMIESAEQAIVA